RPHRERLRVRGEVRPAGGGPGNLRPRGGAAAPPVFTVRQLRAPPRSRGGGRGGRAGRRRRAVAYPPHLSVSQRATSACLHQREAMVTRSSSGVNGAQETERIDQMIAKNTWYGAVLAAAMMVAVAPGRAAAKHGADDAPGDIKGEGAGHPAMI